MSGTEGFLVGLALIFLWGWVVNAFRNGKLTEEKREYEGLRHRIDKEIKLRNNQKRYIGIIDGDVIDVEAVPKRALPKMEDNPDALSSRRESHHYWDNPRSSKRVEWYHLPGESIRKDYND